MSLLQKIRAKIIMFVSLGLHTINVIFWAIMVFICAFLELIPIKSWRAKLHVFMNRMPIYWIDCCNGIQKLLTKTEWDIQGVDHLKQDDWYLVICNHQSWADILVLGKVFNRKIPVLKFFMKKQLLWLLPIGGWGAWLLDYPFMERYSKEFLAKHPELQGKDMETTRKVCAKFKYIPTAIVSFIESTRFTPEKRKHQDSPYQHLLRPRAGGMAFALGAMGEYFHKILDVTIVYPSEMPSIWDYFSGSIKKIIVRVNVLSIPPELLGDYEKDREYRKYFQNYINKIWRDKDQLIQNSKNMEKSL